jgi:hypothetical protein
LTTSRRTTCAVLQPGYLPWLGFFEQVWRADEFVFLDDVQFDKHGWRNRNRIKGPAGPQWLTVPVRTYGRSQPLIREVEIDSTQCRWAAKHIQALRTNYGPCPFFDWLFPDLERSLRRPWSRIAELNYASTKLLCDKLGLRSTFHHSTALHVGGDRCERLIRICQAVGCNHYYSGAAARDYLDIAGFERAGITVEFQDYAHPEYPQRYGAFVSHLSVIDLLFNCGPRSADVLLGTSAVRSFPSPSKG